MKIRRRKRSHAAASIHYFSYWILVCGLALMLAPGILLELVDITMNPDILARLFGMVLLCLAFYYQMVSRHEEMREFYRWTTYTRFLVLPCVTVLVLLGLGKPIVIGFVAIDFVGALWTTLALRKDVLVIAEKLARSAEVRA